MSEKKYLTLKTRKKITILHIVAFMVIFLCLVTACASKPVEQTEQTTDKTRSVPSDNVEQSTDTQEYNPESDFRIDWDSNVKNGVVITEYKGTKKEVRIPPKYTKQPGYRYWEERF